MFYLLLLNELHLGLSYLSYDTKIVILLRSVTIEKKLGFTHFTLSTMNMALTGERDLTYFQLQRTRSRYVVKIVYSSRCSSSDWCDIGSMWFDNVCASWEGLCISYFPRGRRRRNKERSCLRLRLD